MKIVHWLYVLVALLSVSLMVSCSCDDDDDDDDDTTADDDEADDDLGDDDATGFPCEDAYDLILEGHTDFPSGSNDWTARLIIADNGDITGNVTPTYPAMDPYDVTGFRYEQTTGCLEGSFPTPENMQAACTETTVYNHVNFTIELGEMDGDVTFYCGSPTGAEITNEPVWGDVTCGDYTI